MKYFVLILICAAINSLDDANKDYRKLYGLSYHKNCGNYFVTFKCMTACKGMGFQVFRLDFKCKCTCHELKTTTILPAFVWRTNGTTKRVPATLSPKLYAIVGTLSPPPQETTVPDTTLLTTEVGGCGGANNTFVTTDTTDNNTTTSNGTSQNNTQTTTPKNNTYFK